MADSSAQQVPRRQPADDSQRPEDTKKRKANDPSSIAEEHGNKMLYDCRFCDMKFTKSQALGGHMNRHRQEREREQYMQARELVMAQQSPSFHASWNMDGSCANFNHGGNSYAPQPVSALPSSNMYHPGQSAGNMQNWPNLVATHTIAQGAGGHGLDGTRTIQTSAWELLAGGFHPRQTLGNFGNQVDLHMGLPTPDANGGLQPMTMPVSNHGMGTHGLQNRGNLNDMIQSSHVTNQNYMMQVPNYNPQVNQCLFKDSAEHQTPSFLQSTGNLHIDPTGNLAPTQSFLQLGENPFLSTPRIHYGRGPQTVVQPFSTMQYPAGSEKGSGSGSEIINLPLEQEQELLSPKRSAQGILVGNSSEGFKGSST